MSLSSTFQHFILNCSRSNLWSQMLQEFLPFVTESVDDEDEVLIALSASLGRLVPHIGGPAYAHTLLRPLELLLSVGKLYLESYEF